MTTGQIICVIIGIILAVLVVKQVQGIRKTVKEYKEKKAAKSDNESLNNASVVTDINKKEEEDDGCNTINH